MLASDFTYLEQVFLPYGALTPEQQTQLRQACRKRTFEKGDMLHRGSLDCAGLFIVQKGQLRCYFVSQEGREITLYRLLERDICLLSASCIIKNIRFEVQVSAERETEAILIPSPVYDRLMRQSLPVADYTNELIASHFSEVVWVMEQVLFSRFDQRLAAFLIEQSALENSEMLHVTHEEIARHLGTAREVVTRMLRYFQSEGAVSLSRGSITIADPQKLGQMA